MSLSKSVGIAVLLVVVSLSGSCWSGVGATRVGTSAFTLSTTTFVDAEGNVFDYCSDVDDIYVKVLDPSHAGASLIENAVEIEGHRFDLRPMEGASSATFITDAISMVSLGVEPGDVLTATYSDPTNSIDTSSDTIQVISMWSPNVLIDPIPFEDEVTFDYDGPGIALTFSVEIYDLTGKLLWSEALVGVREVIWNGTDGAGEEVSSGLYIYVYVFTVTTDAIGDEIGTLTGKGVVVKR